MAKPRAKKYMHYHKDGTVWAVGQKTGEIMTGYWEWFRKDGVRMRSGYFDACGAQTGEWVTYDKRGKVYKVTTMKPKVAKPKKASSEKTKR